jgi:hypothetical protein
VSGLSVVDVTGRRLTYGNMFRIWTDDFQGPSNWRGVKGL